MITPGNVDESVKTHVVTYKVENLSAGADLAAIPFFRVPKDIEIVAVGILAEANSAGIDGSNKSKWEVKVGATVVATKEYDAIHSAGSGVKFPAKSGYDVIPVVAAAAKRLKGDVLVLDITNGATADTPPATVQVQYIYLNEAIFDN